MNNNNRNNRRRGRGNRNQGGNGAQLNRIDSRARGNAPQMLDKYKKLAQDAQHNGDRVQMEYYLQFADHYFRVIADNKARADEQRGPGGQGRREEREQAEDYAADDLDFDRGRHSEQPIRTRYEQPGMAMRTDGDDGEPGQEGEAFSDDESESESAEVQPRTTASRRQPRKPRGEGRSENRDDPRAERPARSVRAPRGEARAERSPERSPERSDAKPAARSRKPRKAGDNDGHGGIDSSILPPAIRSEEPGNGSPDGDGTLEAVG